MKRFVEMMFGPYLTAAFPIRLHVRSDLHVARKLWHMSMGVLIASAYISGLSKSSAVITLGFILAADLMIESIRLRVPAFNEKIIRLWGPLMRTSETVRFSGVSYFLASTILAIAVFPKPVAILSVLYLAFGDPMASLFGVLYGKYSVRFSNGKSLIGTLAGMAICGLITFLFLSGLSFSNGECWMLSVLGGAAAGFAELLPLEIDDNFSIPIISGFVLWFAFILMGQF